MSKYRDTIGLCGDDYIEIVGESEEGTDLDLVCKCGRKDFTEDEGTFYGTGYAYIICAECGRLINVTWDQYGYYDYIFIEDEPTGNYEKFRNS